MKRAPRSRGAWALSALLGLMMAMPAAAPPANADDEEGPPLSTCLFHVGALTAGRSQFVGEQPPPVPPGAVRDERRPLFGREFEVPDFPLGGADELIELLKAAVQPKMWEEIEGADILSFSESVLAVRARPDMVDAVAAHLAKLEAGALRSVRIEVRALRVEEGREVPKDAAALAQALSGPAAGPSLSLVAFLNQRVSAFSGREYAYVGDYHVDVAQESSVSDPVVQVANVGLGVDARVALGGGRDAVVDVDLHLSELERPRTMDAGHGRTMDTPVFSGTFVDALVEAQLGAWTPAGGNASDGWTFFVRVTPSVPDVTAAKPSPLPVLRYSEEDHELRYFDVTDLALAPRPRRSWPRHLLPQGYTPPEPRPLPEVTPVFPEDRLVDLIHELGIDGAWEDPAALEARNGRLIARNGPAVLTGVERTLQTLRRELIRPMTTTAEVVELPSELTRSLGGAAAAPHVLTDAGAEALAAALTDGRARRVERATVIHHGGVPNAVSFGRHVSYVQDYRTEIAQGSSISDPVMLSFFSGLQLDVRADRTSDGRSVAMEVRLMRTEHEEPIRTLDGPAGRVELPELHVFRVRTALHVPLGRPVLVASQGDEEHSRILLLTTR